jgi:hypothetical protein
MELETPTVEPCLCQLAKRADTTSERRATAVFAGGIWPARRGSARFCSRLVDVVGSPGETPAARSGMGPGKGLFGDV